MSSEAQVDAEAEAESPSASASELAETTTAQQTERDLEHPWPYLHSSLQSSPQAVTHTD